MASVFRREWTEARWIQLERSTRAAIQGSGSEREAWRRINRSARCVLRAFSTSFFLVTRFLPPEKREAVEIIYAAVRYPDEVVDTFPLSAEERSVRLDVWRGAYARALTRRSLRESVDAESPLFPAAFAAVVKRYGIPHEHYASFLDAMERDIRPKPFPALDALVDEYIYGSAIVVGYFLAHVYGPSAPGELPRALAAARNLGIALQLTNFTRDIGEDWRRGRVYMPLDLLEYEGIHELRPGDPAQREPLARAAARLTAIAEAHYAEAEANLDAFAADSRTAIHACIDVYRQLNQRIAANSRGVARRATVPMRHKFRVLPPSKYWRLPLAYLSR